MGKKKNKKMKSSQLKKKPDFKIRLDSKKALLDEMGHLAFEMLKDFKAPVMKKKNKYDRKQDKKQVRKELSNE